MIQTSEKTLTFALDQLRWALALPHRCGDADWGQRLGRSLLGLEDALERHVAFMESPIGVLNQVADPALLPLNRLIRVAQELRQQHQDFLERLAALRQQLQDLDGELGAGAEGEPAGGLRGEEVRVFLEMEALRRRAEQLLADMETHRASEADLSGLTGRQELNN
jgi:hypothetical protein